MEGPLWDMSTATFTGRKPPKHLRTDGYAISVPMAGKYHSPRINMGLNVKIDLGVGGLD